MTFFYFQLGLLAAAAAAYWWQRRRGRRPALCRRGRRPPKAAPVGGTRIEVIEATPAIS